MGNREARTQAAQRAFEAELQKHRDRDDLTALLKFLAESLENDTSEQMRRFWSKMLSLLGLVVLFAIFCDYSFEGTPEQRWALLLIPLAFLWLVTVPTGSAIRPAMVQAITETLLTPVTYSPKQKQLIVRIMESTITESLLRETCAHALNRSV